MEETTALAGIAGQWGMTQATLILAAWGVVLSRYNRVNDVVFGSIVSGRPSELADADRMVGAFINAVPVRVQPGAPNHSGNWRSPFSRSWHPPNSFTTRRWLRFRTSRRSGASCSRTW